MNYIKESIQPLYDEKGNLIDIDFKSDEANEESCEDKED